MKEQVIRQMDMELRLAGEQTGLSPAMLQLEKLRITSTMELPKMDFLLSLYGTPCMPRRELVGVTGKAKSGKTFVVSMLMAKGASPCPSGRGDAMPVLGRLGEAPLRVLWYDTEQSDESTQDILKNRILKMMGTTPGDTLPKEDTGEGLLEVFNVRCVEWQQRRSLLLEAVKLCKPDLVVIDGIRDLINDINDGVLAQEVMEELMQLAAAANCCIVCVLHENKGSEDHNLRGWIGTELMNKAFEIYTCEKLMPQRIFKFKQDKTRKYDICSPLYFEVDKQGLPCMVSAATAETTAGTSTSGKSTMPPLNSAYIIHEETGGWHFDVERLFNDAFRGDDRVQAAEFRDRVMSLSGIIQPFKYNQLLKEAIEQEIIKREKVGDLTYYSVTPF